MTHPWFTGQRETPEDPLWYWMAERHHIWQLREEGKPKPWTTDPILQRFRFCNVFRELDKVTIWIRENIREPFANHPYLWFMLAIARTINFPPTLLELIHSPKAWPSESGFEPKHMTAVLDARRNRNEQVYTGAYMVRAESDPNKYWYRWSKQRYISEIVLGRLWEDRARLTAWIEGADRLETVWTELVREKEFVGWGPFMTYEVVTDLRWTRYLRGAKDIMTWACAGPGALRGLRRLMGREGRLAQAKITQRQAVPAMKRLLDMARSKLPPGFGALEMRDIEHSLCEVDKYLRVYYGEGKPRAAYSGA